jgi:hypothetical protein
MKAEIVDDLVVIMFAEKSLGFYRGRAVEYIGLHPDLAIKLGKDLVKLGTELKKGAKS